MIEDILGRYDCARPEDNAAIIKELATRADEALPVLIQVLRTPKKRLWIPAVVVIRAIGYPANAPAIPVLLAHVGHLNSPARGPAGDAMLAMGPQVAVPHFIGWLLHHNTSHMDNAEEVDGLCYLLWGAGPEYVEPCGPAIAYLLALDTADLDKDVLLDVLVQIGEKCAPYATPVLINLARMQDVPVFAAKARALLGSFGEETLRPYAAAVADLPASSTGTDI